MACLARYGSVMTYLVAANGSVSEAVDVGLQHAGQTLLDDVRTNVQVLEQQQIEGAYWISQRAKAFNQQPSKDKCRKAW